MLGPVKFSKGSLFLNGFRIDTGQRGEEKKDGKQHSLCYIKSYCSKAWSEVLLQVSKETQDINLKIASLRSAVTHDIIMGQSSMLVMLRG